MAKKIVCPNLLCRSKDVTPITEKKKYSAVKGTLGSAVGGFVLGVPGVIAGAATGINGSKKVTFRCNKCGSVFTEKV